MYKLLIIISEDLMQEDLLKKIMKILIEDCLGVQTSKDYDIMRLE
jgi:hypothetical protein